MPWREQPTSRSIDCNGELVQFFRKQKGWTQESFASAAGYSLRLIAKAEASGSLDPETVEVLADTLSSEGRLVYPEDLTSSPKDLAVSFLRAYAQHEANMVSHCRHFMSPDFEGHFPGGPECEPLSGLHQGPDGYDIFVKDFFRIFSRVDKELAEETMVITTNGNHAVVVHFERITNDYIPPDAPAGIVVLNLLFSRGKLISVQHVFDTKLFGEVVSRWRDNAPASHVDHTYVHHIPLPETNGQ